MFFPVNFYDPCNLSALVFANATLPAAVNWNASRHNGTIWVSIGDAGNTENPTAYSEDGGATWSAGTGAYTNVFKGAGLAWNGTIWAAYGADSGTHKAMTSTDGKAWTQRTLTGGEYNLTTPNGFAAIDGTFYHFSDLNSAPSVRDLYYATNGYTFSTATDVMPDSGQDWTALDSNGTYTLAVSGGTTGATSVAARIINTSLPTGTWETLTMPASATWRHIKWTGRCWFATNRAGTGARSYDNGDTWDLLTLPIATETGGVTTTLYGEPCVTNARGIVLPVFTRSDSSIGTRTYVSCDDGSSWTNIEAAQQGHWKGASSNGLAIVMIGNSGTGSTKAQYTPALL